MTIELRSHPMYLTHMIFASGIAEPELEIEQNLDSMWEVILHNDDHNSADFVVFCLMKVFQHNIHLAAKIMAEAHQRGSAVAEVEEKEQAELHCKQLQSYGLSASIRAV